MTNRINYVWANDNNNRNQFVFPQRNRHKLEDPIDLFECHQMSVDIFLFNWTTISAYFHPVVVDILPQNLSAVVEDCINTSKNILQVVTDHLSCPLEFTDLQLVLLTIFLVIIFVNLLLIGFYWNKYGGVITDRFIRPSKLHWHWLWLWVTIILLFVHLW